MVREWPLPEQRPGFTLVEVVIALLILTVGIFGIVGTQILATRLLNEAEARTTAIDLASQVADSLLATPAPLSGEWEDSRHRVEWRVGVVDEWARVVNLEIVYDAGASLRTLEFELLHLSPIPRIGDHD